MDKVTIPTQIIKTPCLTILSDRIIRGTKRKKYPGTDELAEIANTITASKRGIHENSAENLNKDGDGTMSYHTRLSIRKAGSIFRMRMAESHGHGEKGKKQKYLRGCFMTLTIAGMDEVVDSKKGYSKLIKKAIQWLMYRYDIRDYLWRFEWQERGQGHWHILVDRFVVQDEVRKYWWGLLQEMDMTKSFNEKHDFIPASCCRVQGIRSDSKLDNYLWEYFYKSDQSKKPTEGRWWGASENLKKSPLPILPVDEGFDQRMTWAAIDGRADVLDVEVEIEKPPKMTFLGEIRQSEKVLVCTVIFPKKGPVRDLLLPNQQDILDQYILCYRQGAWERAREMAAAFGEINEKRKEWIEHHQEVARDMAALRKVDIQDFKSKRKLTGIQRRNLVRRRQAEKALLQQAGVSLFT